MSSNDDGPHPIIDGVRDIVDDDGTVSQRLDGVCRLLRDRIAHYDWVGFYVADPVEEVLYLGPFAGAPTDHVRIPFGKGICGQAASGKRTFIVQDVSKEDNYLSCGSAVRSEIVVPVKDGSEVIGELDIDSHSLSPFTDMDRTLLEGICMICLPLVREYRESIRALRVQP